MTKLIIPKNQSLILLTKLIKGLAFILLANYVSMAAAQEQSAIKDMIGKDLTQLTGLNAVDLVMGGWANSRVYL